jgi:hypothetical protein
MTTDSRPLPPTQSQRSLPQTLSIAGLPKGLPNEIILREFSSLYEAIIAYIRMFYTVGPVLSGGASQIMIEQASTGLLLPWPQILDLLGDAKTRLGVLTMVIARSILSRSCLLKPGISNRPGATFLPPEVVDCFQSFCVGKSAITLDGEEPKPVDVALLSRWNQISATLLRSAYVTYAFSPFDGRTVNIERAMEDLDPLLATYAISHDAGREKGARLSELRDVLRKGARFAFTLFSQPCFWDFDWYSERDDKAGEKHLEPSDTQRVEDSAASSANAHSTLSLANIVVWPRLLMIMDQDGCRLGDEGGGIACGKKRYLEQLCHGNQKTLPDGQ